MRLSHAVDESYHSWSEGVKLPLAVVFPQTTEEVSSIARICHEYNAPMIAFGTGTSLEGHITALHSGTVVIDMSHMGRILEVNAGDMDCLVEAGVTRVQLNDALRQEGLFFSVDPGANASLGGMASTRASGTLPTIITLELSSNLSIPHFFMTRYNDGQVWSNEGQRHGHHGRPRRRLHPPHGRQVPQERERVRPHEPARGRRGHAGAHHRGAAATAPRAGDRRRGGVLLPLTGGRGADRAGCHAELG